MHVLQLHVRMDIMTNLERKKKEWWLNEGCRFFLHKIRAFNIFQVYFTIYRQYIILKFEHFHKYLMQHSLKLGGTSYHFKWVKVPGTTSLVERPARYPTCMYLYFTKLSRPMFYQGYFLLPVKNIWKDISGRTIYFLKNWEIDHYKI